MKLGQFELNKNTLLSEVELDLINKHLEAWDLHLIAKKNDKILSETIMNGNIPFTHIITLTEDDSYTVELNKTAFSLKLNLKNEKDDVGVNLEIINSTGYNVGNTISYKVNVKNNGKDPVYSIIISNIFDGSKLELVGINFGSNFGSGSKFQNNQLSWVIEKLGGGSEAYVILTFKLINSGSATLTSSVTNVSGNIAKNPSATSKITINAPAKSTNAQAHMPNVSIAQSISYKTKYVGDYVTYTIKVTNNGGNTVSFNVIEKLSSKLQFKSYSVSGGSYNSKTGTLTVKNLKSHGTVTLNIKAKIKSKATITTTAQITGLSGNTGKSSVTSTITSKKLSIKPKASTGKKISHGKVKITIKFTDSKKQVVKSKKIKVYYKNKKIGTFKTNKKGKITLKFKYNKKVKKLVFKCKSTTSYNKLSKTIKFKVKG
jgi:uncharacterized repeat protein (TIGR01451 family)